jgi:U3 small nucleolar RNA-associated protein 12
VLCDCGDKARFMAGYSNGDIVVFNYVTKQLISTLHGHSSAVTSIAIDKARTGIAASGSADTSIIVWDLVALAPLNKLTGHKDSVTGVDFLYNGTQPLVVSVSKDTLLKVWDLESSVCVQTVVGHRSEIWSVTVIDQTKVITGCADDMLRGFRIAEGSNNDNSSSTRIVDVGEGETALLEYYGCVRRTASGTDRCASLSVNSVKNMLAAQSNGKVVEVTHV